MKNTHNFAAVLKNLIQITDVKMAYVAKAVGYDISYISKWCGNANLPPKKNADSINRRLSKLFAQEIFVQKRTGLLHDLFPEVFLETIENQQIVQEGLEKILEEAYINSKQKNIVKQLEKEKDNEIQLWVGRTKLLPALGATLREIIENAEQDIEVISTIDMLKILKHVDIESILPYHRKGIQVYFNLCLNKDELFKEPDFYFKKLYHFLNIHLNNVITIYDQKDFTQYNVLAVKNKIAFLFAINKDGLMEIAAEIKEVALVNTIYKMAEGQLSPQSIILKPETSVQLQKGGYRTKFYTAEEFRFFSAFGFEYLLPADIFDKISKEGARLSGDTQMEHFVKRLQITWEEFFINGKIQFVIPKSNILSYIEHGRLFYLDIPFTMSVEQRRRHARHIVESMRANKKIRFTVLDDDRFSYLENYYNISIYYNKNKAFFKKNAHALDKVENQFYVILCDRIIQYLDTFFENLGKAPFCQDYSADEAEEMINKYEKMLLRMLHLGQEL